MNYELTEQQKQFCDKLLHSEDSIILEAVSGSGKSTTLEAGINAYCKKNPRASVGCIAFNKRIADEIAIALPDAECRTFNAFGHRAWSKSVSKRLFVKKGKMLDISKSFQDTNSFELCAAARQLAIKAKTAGIVPDGAMGSYIALHDDLDHNWTHLLDLYDIDTDDKDTKVIALAHSMLLVSIEQAFTGSIDFDDQIYMTACWRAPLPKFDLLAVDEAQDVSGIQREMVRRMARRVVAAGDRNQAIYAFRGASHTSMDDFQQMFEALEMPLTVSFRCPKAVVKLAQRYVPHIESALGAPNGTIVPLQEFNSNLIPRGHTECAIICRNNAPIISVAFGLLRDGVGCVVLGREIGAGLKTLIKKFERKASSIEHLNIMLATYLEEHGARLKEKKRFHQLHALKDKIESIFAISNNVETIEGLVVCIDIMFEGAGRVKLGTIHKLKGAEFPHVFFLEPGLIPSRYAQSKAQLQQEDNLAYVAITRTKSVLSFVNLPKRKEE